MLLGAILCLVTCLASEPATAAEKLRVGYNIWVGSSGVFVAQSQGYFKQAGLEVEFVPFNGPGDTLPALMAGNVDIGLTTADNVVLIDSRSSADLKIIYATDASNGADALVSKKTVGNLRDLTGKTIAVTLGEVNELLLLKALEGAGMKRGDIKAVNMDPDSAGAAFVAGKIDAAVTWEPWVSRAVANGDGRVVFSSAQAPNLILDVIAVQPSMLQSRKKAIAAFLGAVDRGTALLKANPDQAIPLAAKWLEVRPPEVKNMLAGVHIFGLPENAALFREGTVARTLDDVTAFFREHNAITRSAKASDMLDGSLVLTR